MTPPIFINIVTWNSMTYLPELMKSIEEQTLRNFSVLVVDNGSTDDTVLFLKEHYPSVTLVRNARNLGFGPAHNQGIRFVLDHWDKADGSECFILITNQDSILTPPFLETLWNAAKEYPMTGSFGGKILRAYGENLSDELFRETVRSDRIDSTGLRAYRNRTVTDRGAGEIDKGQYDDRREVFGISGALAFYRAEALKDVAYRDEYFDSDFFAYKEDVDLAWRLQSRGWQALYVPEALAYHYRGLYGKEFVSLRERLKNRKKKPWMRNFYSTRNHWLMLVKNLHWIHFVFNMPFILFHETGRLIYVLLFEQAGLKTVIATLRLIPKMFQKRFVIARARKVPLTEMGKWFRG